MSNDPTPVQLFPSWNDPTVAVGTAWRLDDVPVPVPLFRPACPVCRGGRILLRSWRWFDRGITARFRCDVSFKCLSCCAVWQHGLALQRSQRKANGAVVEWREGRQLLLDAGVIDDNGRLLLEATP
jgi:hypothetical protein